MSNAKRHAIVRSVEDVEAGICSLCGQSTRIITAADGATMSIHVTHIRDAKPHLHETLDEMYFVMDGEGTLEIDGRKHPVKRGTAAYIPAGTVHRGSGDFTAVIVVNPAFDPDDEIVVGSE